MMLTHTHTHKLWERAPNTTSDWCPHNEVHNTAWYTHIHSSLCEHQGSETVCRERGLQRLHESCFSWKYPINHVSHILYVNWPYRERPPGQKVNTHTNIRNGEKGSLNRPSWLSLCHLIYKSMTARRAAKTCRVYMCVYVCAGTGKSSHLSIINKQQIILHIQFLQIPLNTHLAKWGPAKNSNVFTKASFCFSITNLGILI